MTDWLATAELFAAAGAEGRLRCEECGIVVTVDDPFDDERMLWADVDRWIEDGEPKARCRVH